MHKHNFCIGIVGSLASGKGVIADYLIKSHGFISFSLSYIVHEEVKKRQIKEYMRKILQDIGDELRTKHGDDILAKKTCEYLSKEGVGNTKYPTRVVIEGIRNPGEVAYLRKMPHFILIGVDANQSLRYKRVVNRGKPWDPKDWESFVKVDKRDWGTGKDDSGQQVKRCMQMADYIVDNNKDLKSFYSVIDQLIDHIAMHHKDFKEVFGNR